MKKMYKIYTTIQVALSRDGPIILLFNQDSQDFALAFDILLSLKYCV
jgi:hypothetical protein